MVNDKKLAYRRQIKDEIFRLRDERGELERRIGMFSVRRTEADEKASTPEVRYRIHQLRSREDELERKLYRLDPEYHHGEYTRENIDRYMRPHDEGRSDRYKERVRREAKARATLEDHGVKWPADHAAKHAEAAKKGWRNRT